MLKKNEINKKTQVEKWEYMAVELKKESRISSICKFHSMYTLRVKCDATAESERPDLLDTA